jgi:hypothetical protein
MPRATVVKTTEHFDLETVEGGWVELRRLSYGEKLRKDADAMQMKFDTQGMASGDGAVASIAMVNEAVTLREFALCIMDHNLDDGGNDEVDPPVAPRKLNFGKPVDVRSLDPRTGDEISGLINKLNDFERSATTSVKNDEGK